ncbi:MAG: hypothetical protein COT85_02795 [Chlamydiae bacterium CG10_big_fil_rev_8_21_14_0_10_42_34]|nr:MAG: hypothetical protein COT85_02795 [Chlamydiae bacterium CG10_big_fil_rev_8_21_14_0_10_42_34]
MIDPISNVDHAAPPFIPPVDVGRALPRARPRDSISPAPQKQKGFVELGVLALRDLALLLFDKIYTFFKGLSLPNQPPYREPAVLRGPAEPLPQEIDQPNPHQELLGRLPQMQNSDEIINYFAQYFSEAERKEVYAEIGRAAPWCLRDLVFQSSEEIGNAMVQKDPRLVLAHLINKVSQEANRN